MDCMRVNRGQVFMYNPLKSVCTLDDKPVRNIKMKGYLQQKERPYLVVSNNKCNASSHIVTVVPITTRDETKIPVQVKFFFEGRCQVVLVEQICTANIEDLGDYVCTVSDTILEHVTNAIMLQVGYESKTSYMLLESFICELNKISYRLSEDVKKRKSLVDSKQIKEVTDNILKMITESFPSDLEIGENVLQEETKISTLKSHKGKCKYTTELMEQILLDYKELSISEFMIKYQCPTKKAATDKVYYVKRKLQNIEQK